jgi:hypothetical protein
MNKKYDLTSVKNFLTFPFKDEKWLKKFGLLTLISLACFIIPIVPHIFLSGYAFEMKRRIINENSDPYLPEVKLTGKMFKDGLKMFGAGFVGFTLPFGIIFGGASVILFASFILIVGYTANTNDPGLFSFVFLFQWLLIGLISILSILSTVFMAVFYPPAICHVVAKDSFSAVFNIGEWWKILKKGFSSFLIANIMLIGLYTIIMMVFQAAYLTFILLPLALLAIILFGTYIYLVMSALYATAYKEGRGEL